MGKNTMNIKLKKEKNAEKQKRMWLEECLIVLKSLQHL